MSVEAPEPQSKRPTVTVVTTYLVDSWLRHGNLWKLRASQVVLQGTRQQEGRLDKK